MMERLVLNHFLISLFEKFGINYYPRTYLPQPDFQGLNYNYCLLFSCNILKMVYIFCQDLNSRRFGNTQMSKSGQFWQVIFFNGIIQSMKNNFDKIRPQHSSKVSSIKLQKKIAKL